MTLKTFFIALLIVFVVYEALSITIGYIKAKKKKKENENIEKGDNNDVSN